MTVLAWLGDALLDTEPLTEERLRRQFKDGRLQEAVLLLNYLQARGIVTSSPQRGETVYRLLDAERLRTFLSQATAETDQNTASAARARPTPASDEKSRGLTIDTEYLVVTTPLSLVGRLNALRNAHAPLPVLEMREAFSRLLSSGQNEVLLSLPFLELDGLMVFVNEVRELGQRRVKVKALTRELLSPRRTDVAYYQKLRAFGKLIDLYEAGGGDGAAIEVRDFTIKLGQPGEGSLLYESIHQKMIVVDRQRAYVGSGEIRAPSFIVNGDVGVMQTGRAAEFWADYFLLFWSEARPMARTFFG